MVEYGVFIAYLSLQYQSQIVVDPLSGKPKGPVQHSKTPFSGGTQTVFQQVRLFLSLAIHPYSSYLPSTPFDIMLQCISFSNHDLFWWKF